MKRKDRVFRATEMAAFWGWSEVMDSRAKAHFWTVRATYAKSACGFLHSADGIRAVSAEEVRCQTCRKRLEKLGIEA